MNKEFEVTLATRKDIKLKRSPFLFSLSFPPLVLKEICPEAFQSNELQLCAQEFSTPCNVFLVHEAHDGVNSSSDMSEKQMAEQHCRSAHGES